MTTRTCRVAAVFPEPTPRRGSTLACVAAALLLGSPVKAQRRPPALEGYAQKAGAGPWEMVSTGILVWDYWGIMIPTCSHGKGVVGCRLVVSNGSATTHEICLGAPALHAKGGSPSLPMRFATIKSGARPDAVRKWSRDSVCTILAPHKEIKLDVVAAAPPFAPVALALTLVEPRSSAQGGAMLRAPATLPIVLSQPPEARR